MKTIKAGTILINTNDNTVALVYRENYDDYSFPKGHLEDGETLLECAIRETNEETKKDCALLKKTPIFIEEYITSNNEEVSVTYYLCKVTGESDNKSLDNHPTIWVPLDNVESKLTYNNLKKQWRHIKNDLEKYYVDK